MKIFLDSEFTKLDKNGELISLGLVTEDNTEFYAEFNDYNGNYINTWLQRNVINHLFYNNVKIYNYEYNSNEMHYNQYCKHDKWNISKVLECWLKQFDEIEIWSDCLAYDWIFFCNLFGGAFGIPNNVYYIPFDISTLMKIKGVNPDINREEFINNSVKGNKHNALYDAKVIKACYEKLMEM